MDAATTQAMDTTVTVAKEFATYPVVDKNVPVINEIRIGFDKLLKDIEVKIPGGNARYLAIVKTHLEIACQFAVKGVAVPVTN